MRAGKPWPSQTPIPAGPEREEALTARLEAAPGLLHGRIGTSLRAVVLSGIALTLPALAFGSGAALSVAAGAALALGNLWVIAKVVSALLPEDSARALRQSRFAWALVAALKTAALLGVMWLLMRQGFVSPLATLIGLLSLPIGIAIGSLVSDRSAPFDDR